MQHPRAQSLDMQVRHGDSLYRALQGMPDEEKKAQALLELSFFWSDYDTVRALHYIDEARQLLGSQGRTDYYRGLFAFYRASALFDSDPQAAKDAYVETDSHLIGQKGDAALRYRARAWGSYGALLQREGNAEGYVEVLLQKVIPMARSIADSTLWGNNLQNVAMTLMNLGQYAKAEPYYKEALQLLHGKAEGAEQRLTLFVNAARNSLFRQDTPRARAFLDSAARLAVAAPLSTYLPVYHSVEGSYWQRLGKLSKALQHFEIALQEAKGLQRNDLVATILYDKYQAYHQAGQQHEALQALLAVLPYVEGKSLLRNKQLTYYNIAQLYRQLGDFKDATRWYEKHKLVSDTLATEGGEARILELEQKYKTAEQQKQLLASTAKNQEQQLSLQRTRTWLIMAGLLCVLLIVISVFYYISLRARRRFALQQERLLQEELKNVQQREKINLFNAMVQGQENERSRIARDLHDGLGGMLAGVKLKLSAVADQQRKPGAEQAAPALPGIIQQLDLSVSELRRVARNMMPESLLYMGLDAALRDLCAALAHGGLQIDFESRGLRARYANSFLIAVYRVVQELLTNAVKHSAASHIWVQCNESEGHFYLSVEDNGKGFDYASAMRHSGGIGLSNIRNRVELLNGHLEVDSALGKGTSFHIELQVNG